MIYVLFVCMACVTGQIIGDVIQDLCQYLKIKDSEAIADFPEEMERFAGVLAQVDHFHMH